MAYLGSGMEEVEKTVATVNMVCDTMTGNGSLATMTIGASQEMPGHVNNVSVYFDGVAQRPTTDYTLSGKTVTFSTVPETGVNVVCLSYASEFLDVISDGTVYGAEILDGAITDAKIASGISASKLTGALPAINGSAVTNFSPRAVTKSASNPTISTNPANGLGTVWANTTSGEMYVCTDATAGENVWTNIGSGQGSYGTVYGGRGLGTVAGYTHGGEGGTNVIDRFTFGSNANAADHGDLSTFRTYMGGHSSITHGYSSGGFGAANVNTSKIDKYAFGSNTTSTVHSNLTLIRRHITGTTNITHGYTAGGYSAATDVLNMIDKFSLANENDSSNHGDLVAALHESAGSNSDTHGYDSGGGNNTPALAVICKFAFATDSNAVNHGNLSAARAYVSGTSSTTDGYTVGGGAPGSFSSIIDRFSFSSNTTAADHGDLTVARPYSAGISNTTHGYIGGGDVAGGPVSNVIDKFAYGSGANATDHGNLSVARKYVAGTQL